MNRDALAVGLLLVGASMLSCNNAGTGGGGADSTGATTGVVTTDTAGGTTSYASSAEKSASAAPLRGQDSSFALEAASGGMMEVELGRMAQQKATNPRVKSFGEMMVRDHSAANDELKNLASAKNLSLPDSMMKKHRDHVASLEKMTGRNFDKQYMDMMVKDHQEDVQKFQQAAGSGTDADLKAWAGKTLPVLQTHLDSARAINSALK